MKQYDVPCPICGTVNRGLYLDETGGWMECEHCRTILMDSNYASKHAVTIPLVRWDQLTQCAVREAV